MAEDEMLAWSSLTGWATVPESQAAMLPSEGGSFTSEQLYSIADEMYLKPEEVMERFGVDVRPSTQIMESGTLGVGNVVRALPALAAAVPLVQKALPAVGGAISSIGAKLGLTGLAGTGAAVAAGGAGLYGLLQALGLGEGEGLFGLDVLGGDTQYVNGIPIGGPGVAEPSKGITLKQWTINYGDHHNEYYLVVKPGTNRRYIMMWNSKTRAWKSWAWRNPTLAVIGKNMPSHRMVTRLRRNLKRHAADARTILKMTSPTSLKGGGRRGYRRHK